VFRPLWLDLLDLLLPPVVGVLLFLGASRLHRLPRVVFGIVLTLAVLVVSVLVVAYFSPLRDWTEEWFHAVGGERAIACAAGLVLLGAVWSQPGRTTSSGFLVVLVVIVAGMLLLDGSGRLWWRYFHPQAWSNVPDADGCIRQSSALTCGPAAATLLLRAHGIHASEGELAYLAGTSLFGTGLSSMAHVLTDRARSLQLSGRVERVPYETWVLRAMPFIAHVQIPGLGGHALFVERLTATEAQVVDPASGQRENLSREAFEKKWEGRAISLRTGPFTLSP